jgi:hypothetical protein
MILCRYYTIVHQSDESSNIRTSGTSSPWMKPSKHTHTREFIGVPQDPVLISFFRYSTVVVKKKKKSDVFTCTRVYVFLQSLFYGFTRDSSGFSISEVLLKKSTSREVQVSLGLRHIRS